MPETQSQNKTPLRRPVMQYSEPPKENKKERIKLWMAGALILVALCIDLIELILDLVGIGVFGVNFIISISADFIFWIWLSLLGVSFTKNPKNLASMGIQAIIGMIPGADMLPELTVAIIIIVILTRAEDKGGMLGKAVNMAEKKML